MTLDNEIREKSFESLGKRFQKDIFKEAQNVFLKHNIIFNLPNLDNLEFIKYDVKLPVTTQRFLVLFFAKFLKKTNVKILRWFPLVSDFKVDEPDYVAIRQEMTLGVSKDLLYDNFVDIQKKNEVDYLQLEPRELFILNQDKMKKHLDFLALGQEEFAEELFITENEIIPMFNENGFWIGLNNKEDFLNKNGDLKFIFRSIIKELKEIENNCYGDEIHKLITGIDEKKADKVFLKYLDEISK